MYYYHVITRKSQWEQPTDLDVEGTITMDLATPEHEQPSDEVCVGVRVGICECEGVWGVTM